MATSNQLKKVFLDRAEWWHAPYHELYLHEELLHLWERFEKKLDKERLENGIPIVLMTKDVGNLTISEIFELHSWCDLLMWAVLGGNENDFE